jgi:glycosyltransferase involved in cell wall biosynthesis
MKNPLRITVVTPSFNQSHFLERTICSVLGQQYPNLEYIVIDGGSSDESIDIIKTYEENLAYWVSEKDGGQAEAISKGFARATGDILCWLNSDDIFLPGALHAVNEYFLNHTRDQVVNGGAIQITETGALFSCWCNYTLGVKASYRRLCLLGQQNLYQPATFWRREAYLTVGGINPELQFIMDLDLFARLAKTRRFGRLPRFLAAFRIHTAAKTSRLQDVHRAELKSFHYEYRYESWFPFLTAVGRHYYWLVMQAEKTFLVASKPWLLRNSNRLVRDPLDWAQLKHAAH